MTDPRKAVLRDRAVVRKVLRERAAHFDDYMAAERVGAGYAAHAAQQARLVLVEITEAWQDADKASRKGR